MTHLVNRLVFDLHCTEEEQAFDLRQQVSSMVLQEQVKEMIDRVCAPYAGAETWINIERLEVDLGVFNTGSVSTSFATAFLQGFEKALGQKLAQAASGASVQSRKHSHMELLQYILLHGVLPWWGTATEPDLNRICEEVIRHDPEGFTRFLLRERSRQSLWKRISHQLTAENGERIIGLLTALSGAAVYLRAWIREIYAKSFDGPLPDAHTMRRILQKIILENAPRLLENPGVAGVPGAMALNEDSLPADAEISRLKLLLFLGEEHAAVAVPGEGDSPAAYTTADETGSESPEKFFIKTGGIVLLAPYFKPFFTELGLLEGDKWVNKAAAYKAVHVLKYLGTGLQNQPEYSLVLEKICCSLSPEEPVPLEMPLEEKDRAEAEQLLAAVIAHWSALKNTSVNGLRESFLKRDAILTRSASASDGGWLLQVERKTLDILLDSIPWGYNQVRLPWNDYIIMVEW